MNIVLLKEIVSHIMAHFGVIPSDFVNLKKSDSLLSPTYLLNEKIFFESDGENYTGKVWGCQMSVAQTQIKVLLGECTTDPEFPEWAMIVQPKDNPIYGLYLCHNTQSDYAPTSQPDLSVSLDGKEWMNCSTFLQATFLAAMEQVRDLQMPWIKCVEYADLYKAMLSFLNHHDKHHSD